MNDLKYFCTTTDSGDAVLADWRWLTGPHLELWQVTKAGDALLRDPSNGAIHFLDTVNGKLERIARDESEFEVLLRIRENAGKWLMPETVDGQAALGIRPGANECLSFKHPPALGGRLDPDNFETCSIPVHFSVAGQIHRQIKDLPPGTPITNIQIEAPRGDAKRPWWKFW